MAKIFAFCNQKGGVGKTTSCINMGCAAAMEGFRVLIADMDPQANATSGLGIDKASLKLSTYDVLMGKQPLAQSLQKTETDKLEVLPSNAQLIGAEIELVSALGREYVLQRCLEEAKANFDLILIDCPPSLGLLTLNSLTAADKIIIPLQCEYYALEGVGQLLSTFNLIKSNLNKKLEIGGVVLTMADFRTNLTGEVINEVKNHFQEKVFSKVVPRSVRLSEAPSFGKPALVYDKNGKGSEAYRDITKELLAKEGLVEEKTEQEPAAENKAAALEAVEQSGT